MLAGSCEETEGPCLEASHEWSCTCSGTPVKGTKRGNSGKPHTRQPGRSTRSVSGRSLRFDSVADLLKRSVVANYKAGLRVTLCEAQRRDMQYADALICAPRIGRPSRARGIAWIQGHCKTDDRTIPIKYREISVREVQCHEGKRL